MLEEMSAFFDNRAGIYDEHMRTHILGAGEFYPATAKHLPMQPIAKVLDLGCGTGLELDEYLPLNPSARITGIDMTKAMLDEIPKKHPDSALTLICDSYFAVSFGENTFDGAVSVESLHHFTEAEKLGLYKRIRTALKPGVAFVNTDYCANSDAEERRFFSELAELREREHIPENAFVHFDTPFTPEHEMKVLREAGFTSVTVEGRWQNTFMIVATK